MVRDSDGHRFQMPVGGQTVSGAQPHGQTITSELAKLMSHLAERLSGTEDGKPKIFRDSAIGNLSEFFERFRELNVRSNADLDRLVADCQRIVRGVEPQDLRDS